MELDTLYGMISKEVSSIGVGNRSKCHLYDSERALIKRGLLGSLEVLNVGDHLRLDCFLNTKTGNGEVVLHYVDSAKTLKRWKIKAKHIERMRMQIALEDDGQPPF